MMSSTTTQRAGRAPKDKNKAQMPAKVPPPKPQTETVKVSENVVSKIQPTAEQLRIAQIINDANKSSYPDLKDKVERIIEITGLTTDAALVALHDCDNDSNRATIMLLEGNQDEGKWETTSKKKKNRQPQQKTPEVNGHEPPPQEKEDKEAVESINKRQRDTKPRDGNYRYRGPPRLNRGGNQGRNWRNKENEKNERNMQDGDVSRRGRNMDGRSRGLRKNFSSGRGRGRGGRSRTFQNRGLQNNDGFPESIETWNNSTADKAQDSTMTVGNWSDVAVAEEWSEEDWSENLTETKVFTPSGTNQSAAVTGLDIPNSGLGQNMDLASFLQKASANTESSASQQMPAGPNPPGHFDFSQFAKQAADQIKAAVGVVSSPAAPSLSSGGGAFQPSSQSGFSSSSYSSATSGSVPLQQQQQTAYNSTPQKTPLPSRQPKPSKARLPPPSKIPESAVVMPDDAVSSIDVQFGALHFGADSSPFDFTATDTSNGYQDLGQSSNASNQLSSQAMPPSITSQSYPSNALPSPVTMSKESTYSSIGTHTSPAQNSLSSDMVQSQKVASQDSMLLTQSDHKNVESVTSYVNHRTNQSSSMDGSLMTSKPDQNAMSSFSTGHVADSTAAYSYATQKPILSTSNLVPSSVGYSPALSAERVPTDLSSSSQTTQPKYQSQSQGGGAAGYGASYGLQQAAYSSSVTTSGSTYPSQTGYSSHVSASYGTNNTGYSGQQNVYSGSVATTTQSVSSMISTSVSSSKLSGSMNHGVKDSSSLLESQHSASQHGYEVSSGASAASSSTPSMSSVLGLVSTSSQTTTTSVLKNSLSATGKAVPSIPQNMPMLGHQYIMGQASLPFYGLQQPLYSYEDMQMLQSKISTVGLQSPVYSYEDMQMLQSKLSTLGYYDVPFQAPTSMTSRDPGMGSVAYTADGKYSRTETDVSSVATSQGGQGSTQGQAFLNPALPPGYGYYITGGMVPGGIHHYAAAPPIFPVPPATNTHGATTNSQFQKANTYGSHSYNSGYDSLTQAQDYSKGSYGAASQNQVKGVSGSGAVADLSGSVYSKTHAQLAKYNDKPGFHGTPPPFNMGGNQGASSYPQFIPVLPHHSPLLHHHMPQEGQQTPAASSQRNPQTQQKASSKQNYAYWATN